MPWTAGDGHVATLGWPVHQARSTQEARAGGAGACGRGAGGCGRLGSRPWQARRHVAAHGWRVPTTHARGRAMQRGLVGRRRYHVGWDTRRARVDSGAARGDPCLASVSSGSSKVYPKVRKEVLFPGFCLLIGPWSPLFCFFFLVVSLGALWLRFLFTKSSTLRRILGIFGGRCIDVFPDSANFDASPILAFPFDVSSADSPGLTHGSFGHIFAATFPLGVGIRFLYLLFLYFWVFVGYFGASLDPIL